MTAPKAGNTAESLAPKNVLDALDTEATVQLTKLETHILNLETDLAGAAKAAKEKVEQGLEEVPHFLHALVATLEERIAALEARIHLFNTRSPHKL